MKKNLVLIAACALFGAGTVSADTWGVIGSFNNWDGDVEMTETTSGIFTVTMESLQGEFKFRANHDWSVNYGAAFLFDITGNASDITMARDGYNFNTPSELTNVTFTIDTNNSTLSISGLPNDMEVVPPVVNNETMYLIGDPAGEWSPSVGIQLANVGDGRFSWEGSLSENQYFAFVTELNNDGDWDALNSHRYGPTTDGTNLVIGAENAVAYPMGSAWCVAATGKYILTLDTKNLILTAEEKAPDTWGLIGGFNDWAGDVAMVQDNFDLNVYSVTMSSLVGDFKFRANGDWSLNFGASGDNVISGNGVYNMTTDGYNFTFVEEVKNVTLSINVFNWTLTVSGLAGDGVENIMVDDCQPTYFNLQGVRTSHPEKGLCIRVVNGKAEKIIVK